VHGATLSVIFSAWGSTFGDFQRICKRENSCHGSETQANANPKRNKERERARESGWGEREGRRAVLNFVG